MEDPIADRDEVQNVSRITDLFVAKEGDAAMNITSGIDDNEVIVRPADEETTDPPKTEQNISAEAIAHVTAICKDINVLHNLRGARKKWGLWLRIPGPSMVGVSAQGTISSSNSYENLLEIKSAKEEARSSARDVEEEIINQSEDEETDEESLDSVTEENAVGEQGPVTEIPRVNNTGGYVGVLPVRRNAQRVALPIRGEGGMTSSIHGLYTPLQKWEFENGFPVDGVSNVTEWAIEVGLAGGDDDDGPALKRKRIVEPPKYGGSSGRIMISSAADPESTRNDDVDAKKEADEETDRKGKGKAKSEKE